MPIRHLVIILGDQLNLDNPVLEGFDLQQDRILMVEASAEATHVWSHKARITLFLSAMRHFAEQLNQQGLSPIYLKLGEHDFESLEQAWALQLTELKPQKVIVCEPGEYRIEQSLIQLCKQENIPLLIRDDTHFMCSRADFKRWAAGGKQLRMEFFYRMMRKKYDVLMDGHTPVGGAWNYDAQNRKAFGKLGPKEVPAPPPINQDQITKEVIAIVEQHFTHHPGSLVNFIWPVTRDGALKFLNDFIAHKLANFGDHQDAMWQGEPGEDNPYFWHSLLSTSLNLKLLNPREVIAAAVLAFQTLNIPLASLEGFIRQILGWREFIRGVYWLDMPNMASANYYQHSRKLPSWYWTGDTHMNCMRQTIQQSMQYGYAHHIQRLMITGMFGVLAELQPPELESWYLAVYVDAVEWVELPNVAGMALFANGGRFTSKPYIASGAYINRMSNYCNNCQYKHDIKTGSHACPITSLYWHFLIKHYASFAANPRTALMVKNVDRFDQHELEAINSFASNLLDNLEVL